jgi:hypothetical protein
VHGRPPAEAPGPQVAGPEQARDPRPPPRDTRHTRPRGPVAMARALGGCLWARAREVPVPPSGHQTAPLPRCPQQVGPRAGAAAQPRGGVPLGGVQRLGQDVRAATAAGTRRPPGRRAPSHGEPQEQPSQIAGSGSSEAPRCKNLMQTEKHLLTTLDIGSQLHAGPAPRASACRLQAFVRCCTRTDEEIRWNAQVLSQSLNLWEGQTAGPL